MEEYKLHCSELKGSGKHEGLERKQGFACLGNYKVVVTLPLNLGIIEIIR
jgi:hypothetical protein